MTNKNNRPCGVVCVRELGSEWVHEEGTGFRCSSTSLIGRSSTPLADLSKLMDRLLRRVPPPPTNPGEGQDYMPFVLRIDHRKA